MFALRHRVLRVPWRAARTPRAGRAGSARKHAQRYEEGSASYPLIAGFRAALDMLLKVGLANIQQRIKLLHGVLEETLKDETYIFSPSPEWRGGSLFLRLHDTRKTEALYLHLQEKNVVTSLRRGAIRISPHFYNTPEELEKTAKLISEFSGT